MKLQLDPADTLTGWSISSPSSLSLNDFPDKIAGLNENSILAYFAATDTTKVLTKSYTSVDLTNYETLILSLASKNFGKNNYDDVEFNYRIKINDTDEYYLPIKETFTDINISLEGVSALDRIEITADHEGEDYIWISEIILEKENVVLDMMNSVKEHIEFELEEVIGDGVLLGTVSGSALDTSIERPDAAYIEQYMVFLIDDGNNSEVHQIDDIDHVGNITFMSTFDGKTLKNTYANAEMRLQFPVVINPDERDIKIPGIVVWGFVPTPIYRTGKLDTFTDAYKVDGNFIQRKEGQLMTIPIQIDCEARQASLLDIAARAVRFWLENKTVWVNGRFHEVDWSEPAIETQPQTGIDIIPKVQYNLNIETQEIFSDRELVAPAGEATIDVTIRRS